ncbi:MAG: SDR family oxidoreductase, partial [Lacrimispora sp.]
LNIKGKVAVVTGGATGIGLATAMEFAAEGAKVAIFNNVQSEVDSAVKQFQEKGYPVYGKCVDIFDFDQVAAFRDDVVKEFGAINIWVNNAAILNSGGYFDEITEDQWDKVMAVNLKGGVFCSRIAAEQMKKQKSGVILNIIAITSYLPIEKSSLYAISKAGMGVFTQIAAAELAPYNIRVVGVHPGLTRTPMIDSFIDNHPEGKSYYTDDIALQRLADPSELAKPIVFLCSDAASYVTGGIVPVTGGKFCIQKPKVPWNDRG